MANKIGIVLALDGEKEFSQGLKTASSAAKEAKSQLKELDTQYAGNANSVEALRAKQEALTNAQQKYTEKVSAAQAGLDHANTTLEKSKTRYSELQKQVDEAKKALEDMEKTGESGSGAYADQAEKVEKLEKALSDQGNECSKAQQKVSDYSTKLNNAQSELNEMNNAVSKNDKYLSEAEKSVDGCASSIDSYGKEVQQATTVTTSWGEKLKTSFSNAVVKAGMQALKKGAQEISQAFKEMVDVGSEFEASMSNVAALSGATGAELDELSAKAQELGSSTKFTASEVSDAFSYMALAGWDTEQMLEGIDGVLDLAAASGMELADASDMITDYLSAFNMEASQATTVADMLTYAQANSNTTAEQLGEAYSNCAANLSAAGQDIETVTALLEAMANQGEKGSTAGTALNAVMRDITNNMEDGAIAIGDATVAVTDQYGNYRDLTDIIADVETATDGMGTAEKQAALSATFTSRSMSAMNLILNEGTEAISSYETSLRSADGAASDMAATMQDNLQGDLTKMDSALEGLGIAAYNYFNGPLRTVVQGVTSIISGITDVLTPQKTEMEQFISTTEDMANELNNTVANSDQAITEAAASSQELSLLGEQLMSLNEVEDKTAAQKERMSEVVDQLSESIPTLAAAYDKESGSLELTNEDLETLIETEKDYMKLQSLQAIAQDEINALADANAQLALAEVYKQQYEDELDFWTDFQDQIQETLNAYWDTGDYEAYAEGIADAQKMIDEALKDGTISANECTEAMEALDSIDPSTDAVLYEKNADALGMVAGKVEDYDKAVKDSAESIGDLEDAVADAQEQYDVIEKAIEETTEAYEENAEASDEITARYQDEIDATTDLVDENGEYIGTLEEVKEQTISAADADKELYDQNGNLVGTYGELAKAVEDETDAVSDASSETKTYAQEVMELREELNDLRASAEDVAKALDASYTDSFNNVMDLFESTKESLAQGINVDFRTTFNGGADETVESMLQTSEDNLVALQNYADNLELVKDHVGQEIAPEFLAYLESLGTDGANTLEHIAITFRQDNGSELITQWSDNYLETLNIQDQIAETLAMDQLFLQNGLDALGSTDAEWDTLHDSMLQAGDMMAEAGESISTLTTTTFNHTAEAAKSAGVAIPEGLSDGLASGEYTIEQATDILNQAMLGQFDALAQLAEQSGLDVSDSLAAGAESGGQAAADAINALIDEMTEAVTNGTTQIETATDEAVSNGVDGAGEGAGEDAGENIDQTIADSVTDNADLITDAVEEVLDAAAESASENTDAFTDAGEAAAQAFADGLANGEEAVTASAEGLADAAVTALTGKDGAFETPANEAWNAYAMGLDSGTEDAEESADGLADAAIASLDGKDEEFEAAGNDAADSYNTALASDTWTADAQAQAAALAQAALDGFNAEETKAGFQAAGGDAADSFNTEIASQAWKNDAKSQAKSLADSAIAGFNEKQPEFVTAGSNMMAGLAQGINNGASQAITAATNVAKRTLEATKAELDIKSPSGRYEKEVGQMADKGFANGLIDGISEVQNASAQMAESALKAAEDDLEIASPSKKFRKKVGQQIPKAVALGIQDSQGEAENAAEVASETIYKVSNKWLKQYEKTHSASRKQTLANEEYYWKQVVKACEEGTDGYNKAAAKLAVVTVGSKKDYDTVAEYYSAIYQAAEDYLTKRETLNTWSLSEELSYWEAVQKQLKKGTDAWYEAQEQINYLSQNMGSINDDQLSQAEKTLEHIQIMNDLSAEEELAYWESIIGGMTKYSDAWYTVTDKINTLKAEATESAAEILKETSLDEIYDAIIDAASDYVDKQESLEQMSLSQELAYWEQVQKEVGKGTDAWYSAQNKINSIQSKIGTTSNMKSLLSAYETYYDVSEKAEMQYWDTVRMQYEEGTDERLKADQYYFDAKEEYTKKLEDLEDEYLKKVENVNTQLESDIKSLTDEYDNAISSRTSTLKNAYSLFDEFTSTSTSGQDLLYNIQTQAAGYEAWSDALDTLEDRGILSDELLADLTEMGPEEIAAIYALSDLTDEELTAYNDAYQRKMDAIQKQAEKENEDLLAETQAQTEALKEQAEKDLAELEEEYNSDLASVNATISNELQTLANNTSIIAEDQTAEIVGAINDGTESLAEYFEKQTAAINEAVTAASTTASNATAAATTSTTSTTSSSSSGSTSNSGISASEITKILELINAGTQKTSLTAKQRSNHSELYKYLVDNYSRALTTAQEKALAKELGVDTSASGWKDKTLTALNKKGFARGGKVEDEFAWMDEELDTVGPEMVVSRSDNALLTRLPANSEIIDARTTDKLLQLAQINPESLVSTIAKQQSVIMDMASTMSSGSELNELTNIPLDSPITPMSMDGMEGMLYDMYDLLSQYIPLIGEPRQIGFNRDQMVEQLADGMSNNFAMRSRRMRS